MKNIDEILKGYGDYHQNPTNKATHMVGIPAIVLAVMILTNWIDLMWPLILATLIYYIYLSRPLGITLTIAFIILGIIAHVIAPEPNVQGGLIFVILFFGGWVIQFIGHGVEGKKPAFLNNITHMLAAPLFIADEILQNFKLH